MDSFASGAGPLVLGIAAVVLAGGFFALVEMALGSVRKGRLRSLAEGGDQACLRALEAVDNSSPYPQVCRLWIAALRILAGVLGGFLVRPPGNPRAEGNLALAYIPLLGLAALILGLVVPRIIAAAAPEKTIARLLPAIRLFSLLSRPLLRCYALINTAARRLFRLDTAAETTGMTEDELRGALAEGEKSGVVESKERTMVEGVFYLGDRPAGAFMTHRSELEWIDSHATAQDVRDLILKKRDQDCFPVAENTLDNILGALYREDFLCALAEGPSWERDFGQRLKSLIRTVSFVPETMSALKAFEAFRRGNTNHLFVMDEYGGFSGILSVRNLIEEIVGELSAAAGEEIRPHENGGWIAGGSVNFDDAIRVLGMDSLAGEDHPDFHTLAGFILSIAEEIPRPGARFVYRGFEFKILSMDGNRIDQVLIAPPKKAHPLPSPTGR
jgi:putative hemolysin